MQLSLTPLGARAPHWVGRFAAVEAVLVLRAAWTARPPRRSPRPWRLTTAPGGRLRIAELAGRVGWSQRHLTRERRAFSGLSPTRWLATEGDFVHDETHAGAGSLADMTIPDAPPPTVWPTLRAHDARGLIRFMVDAFGFEEVVTYGDQPGGSGDVVMHAQLSWPLGGGVMLGSVRDGADDEWPVPPGSVGCYVVTDDPAALHDRAVAAGAEVFQPLHDTDHGSRDFAVRDPEGSRWNFGTYRADPRAAG